MQFITFLSTITTFAAAIVIPGLGSIVPTIPGFDSSPPQEAVESQVFQKAFTLRILTDAYPLWPQESRTLNLALQYQYSLSSMMGMPPFGMVSLSTSLLHQTPEITQVETYVSWADSQHHKNGVNGTLSLVFTLASSDGTPRYSLEVHWVDNFIMRPVGQLWSQFLTDFTFASLKCEAGFCDAKDAIVLNPEDYTFNLNPASECHERSGKCAPLV